VKLEVKAEGPGAKKRGKDDEKGGMAGREEREMGRGPEGNREKK